MKYVMLALLALCILPTLGSANPTPGFYADATLENMQTVPPTDSPGIASASMSWGNEDGGPFDFWINCRNLEDVVTAVTICHGLPGTTGDILYTVVSGDIGGDWEGQDCCLHSTEIAWADAGELYVQICTRAHPDGELRGVLVLEHWDGRTGSPRPVMGPSAAPKRSERPTHP